MCLGRIMALCDFRKVETGVRFPSKAPFMKCLQCGNELIERWRKKFCSRKCVNDHRRAEWVERLKRGEITYSYTNGMIRSWLLETREHRCSKCKLIEWMGEPINLTMEHIDGNACNNQPENLELICWNCHSMTPTFGNKGKRKGTRYYRK